jgi:Dna[CI] antecedent, DciA
MRRDDLQVLARLQRAKQSAQSPAPMLGEEMLSFFKQSVQQRQTKLAKIAQCWVTLVPQSLCDHCVLHALNRGTLTVLVDSASHLYELKQLLLAGLQQQLLLATASSGLRKIALKPGGAEEEKRRVFS